MPCDNESDVLRLSGEKQDRFTTHAVNNKLEQIEILHKLEMQST